MRQASFIVCSLLILAGCEGNTYSTDLPQPAPPIPNTTTYVPGPPYQRQPFNVRAIDVSVDMGQANNILPLRGVYVVDVDYTGAAWLAGLRHGDVILEFAGKPVNSISDMSLALNAQRPGSIARATIRRVDQNTVTEGPISIQF